MRLQALIAALGLTIAVTGQQTSYQTARPQATPPAELITGIKQFPDYALEDLTLACPGYAASDVKQSIDGVTATLTLAGPACNAYGLDYTTLTLVVQYQAADRIRVKITDSLGKQFDLESALFYDSPIYRGPGAGIAALYAFKYIAAPFSFWIVRKSDREVLFDTRGRNLVFEQQYLEISTNVPLDANLYGLGDTIHPLRLGNNITRTLYAADIGDAVDANLYGSHPFYLETRYRPDTASSTHGVLLLSSNGMDITVSQGQVRYRVTGGLLDFYIFTGGTPKETVQQYVSAIGRPAMQSYWTLGFHQCRWGYANTTQLQEVVDDYRSFNIPLETIWADIDYMDQYRDWTLDPNFLDLGTFVDTLHTAGQHFVPIVDAAIYHSNPENRSEDNYDPFYRGVELDTFLRNPDGSLYVGAVWPGYTVFPDFFSKKGQDYWTESIRNFSRLVRYDGLWLDMNEIASFCVGSCGSGRVNQNPVHPPFSLPGELGNVDFSYPEGFNISNATEYASVQIASKSQAAFVSATKAAGASSSSSSSASTSAAVPPKQTPAGPDARFEINYPNYAINNFQGNGDLARSAASPNATHNDPSRQPEYDIHNLFGYSETIATYNGLQSTFPLERPFIITRSTFPGSGRYAGHWGGDNYSKWSYMYYSISQAILFNIFGIPMIGADICGFANNADAELCSRWMQLGAFMPFYRNHNVKASLSQEAYRWSSVTRAARTAIHIRYSLLPYWYTLFYEAHTTGSTVINALFMEFPDEPQLAAIENQFMVGSGLLVIPVLEPGADTVKGVFPGVGTGTRWFDWYSHAPVSARIGENKTLSAPLGHIPLYVRGGTVLPMQGVGYTTSECRTLPFSVLAALDSSGEAKGTMYADDGISIVQKDIASITFKASAGCLVAAVFGNYVLSQSLANVTVLGVATRPGRVTFMAAEMEVVDAQMVRYNETTGALNVIDLEKLTRSGAFPRPGYQSDGSAGGWKLCWT